LRKPSTSFIVLTGEEDESVGIDWQTADRIVCSSEERKQLVPLVDTVVRMAELARAKGLLSLETEVEHCEYPFLKLGLQLVVDGTDPGIIDHILTARIMSSNKSGAPLLEQIISHDGALSIQSGDNPRLIAVKCFAYLGDDADELEALYTKTVLEPDDATAVDDYMRKDGAVGETFAEMRKLLELDDRSIQKALREVDMSQVSAMLQGADSEVRAKVIRNMSKRAANLLVMSDTKKSAEGVKQAVSTLFDIISKLSDRGEITSQ